MDIWHLSVYVVPGVTQNNSDTATRLVPVTLCRRRILRHHVFYDIRSDRVAPQTVRRQSDGAAAASAVPGADPPHAVVGAVDVFLRSRASHTVTEGREQVETVGYRTVCG